MESPASPRRAAGGGSAPLIAGAGDGGAAQGSAAQRLGATRWEVVRDGSGTYTEAAQIISRPLSARR